MQPKSRRLTVGRRAKLKMPTVNNVPVCNILSYNDPVEDFKIVYKQPQKISIERR